MASLAYNGWSASRFEEFDAGSISGSILYVFGFIYVFLSFISGSLSGVVSKVLLQ